MRLSIFAAFFIAFSSTSCTSKTTKVPIGNWKHVSNDELELVLGYSSALIFLNDSLVDTKHPYARTVRHDVDERRVYFLPTVTKFRINDDSLSVFDLYDSVWTKPRHIELLTDDSLILNRMGIRTIYARVKYDVTS